MRWVAFPSNVFSVDGLGWWGETAPDCVRLPPRAAQIVPYDIYWRARQTSGVRVRFATNSKQVGIRARYAQYFNWYNMAPIGIFGYSLWIDGRFYRVSAPTQEGEFIDDQLARNLSGERREMTLYFPSFVDPVLLFVGVDDEAEFWPARPYGRTGRIVYYGQCIEQGLSTTHSGAAYPSIISRMLDMDFINLGFSAFAKCELSVARLIAEIDDAAAYIISVWQGFDNPDELYSSYLSFLRLLRKLRPLVPIVCITPFLQLHEIEEETILPLRRKVIRSAVKEIGGDVFLVEGGDLLGWGETSAFAERYHPNDAGHHLIASRLTPQLEKIIN